MLKSYLSDENLYVSVLIYTIVVTFAIKSADIKDRNFKKHLFSIFGLILIWLIVGPIGLLWSAIFPIATILSLVLIPRKLSLKIFIMFYTLTMFYTKFYGVSSYNRLINVLLMISSLKCISLISDIKNGNVKFFFGSVPPEMGLPLRLCKATTVDIFCYLYCYCGIFTGPFFTYRTFYDMVYSIDGIYVEKSFTSTTNKVSQSNPTLSRSCAWKTICVKKFLIGISLSILYILSNNINFKHKLLDPLYDRHNQTVERGLKLGLYRAYFLCLFMYHMKFRYISCWTLMESIYIALGLGAYPKILLPRITTPPKLSQSDVAIDQLYSSEITYITVKSSDWYKMEFSVEMLDIINSWNPTVNYFMSHYIGGLFVVPLKIPMTLLFSAFWHGIHPGYYISFYSTIFVVFAQKYFKLAFMDWLPSYHRSYKFFDLLRSAIIIKSIPFFFSAIVAWFINQRLIEYSILPFFFLDSLQDFFSVWKDIYFLGHVYIVFICLIAFTKIHCGKFKYN